MKAIHAQVIENVSVQEQINAFILKYTRWIKREHSNVPATGRGRAIYTVDWLLYGQPRSVNYDDPQLTLARG